MDVIHSQKLRQVTTIVNKINVCKGRMSTITELINSHIAGNFVLNVSYTVRKRGNNLVSSESRDILAEKYISILREEYEKLSEELVTLLSLVYLTPESTTKEK